MNYFFYSSFVLVIIFLTKVESHGYLADPPARNVMWRYGFDVPTSNSYTGLNCGGTYTQHTQNGGKCGICGDGYNSNRLHEVGGPFATGTIGKTYNMGSEIDILVQITANHKGYFEFRICPVTNENVEVTQECLDKNMLTIDGNGYRRTLLTAEKKILMKVKLPDGMSCEHCVLQWHYVAGNNWGTDPDGTSGLGKGPQEEYHNCADIKIVNTGSPLLTTTALPVTTTSVPETTIALPVTSSALPVTATALPVIATALPVTTTALPLTTTVAPALTAECFKGDGYYARVDTGCKKFYICMFVGSAWERVIEKNCAPGTVFDTNIMNCNFAHLVKC